MKKLRRIEFSKSFSEFSQFINRNESFIAINFFINLIRKYD